MEKQAIYRVTAAVAAGALLWGVMEVWHMLLGHGAVVTNIGSVALGAVSAVGYYLFSEVDHLGIEFDETIAGIALASVAAIHSAYWFVKPEVIGMGATVGLTAFIGTLVLAFADY